jgi:hypothetical protein
MIIEYIKEFRLLTPAKMIGGFYRNKIWPAELSKRCRELRSQGILDSRKEGKFEVFYLKVAYKPKEELKRTTEPFKREIKASTPQQLFNTSKYYRD